MAKHEILIIESRSAKDIFDDRYEGATLKEVLKLQGVSQSILKWSIKLTLKKPLNMQQINTSSMCILAGMALKRVLR